MRIFGIRTSGSEEGLENTIKESIARFPRNWAFLEVGTAGGLSLRAIRDIAAESGHPTWFVMGTDLPDGYTFNQVELLRNFDNKIHIITDAKQSWNIHKNQAILFLIDAKHFIRQCFNDVFQCAFIDGDHSKNAVMEDFLTLEPKIEKGGFVLFHDAGELERGSDPQPNGEGINVRGALEELGLLENKRSGWKFVREIHGDRAKGGWGNNTVVIEKI